MKHAQETTLCSATSMKLNIRKLIEASDAYICISKLTIIGPENGLLRGLCQAII